MQKQGVNIKRIWQHIRSISARGTDLRASSSLLFESNSLLGGYFGKLEVSQARGFLVKNCKTSSNIIEALLLTIWPYYMDLIPP